MSNYTMVTWLTTTAWRNPVKPESYLFTIHLYCATINQRLYTCSFFWSFAPFSAGLILFSLNVVSNLQKKMLFQKNLAPSGFLPVNAPEISCQQDANWEFSVWICYPLLPSFFSESKPSSLVLTFVHHSEYPKSQQQLFIALYHKKD